MNTTRRLTLSVAALAALAIGGFETKFLFEQNATIASRREDIGHLTQRRAQLEADRERLVRESASIQKLLADQAGLNELVESATFPPATERRAWLDRTSRLKHLFTEHPEQAIPELRLLSERDWLGLGFDAVLSDEAATRKKLAEARNLATSLFAGQASSALRAYLSASNRQLPTDLFQLAPYFKTPPETAVLQRYRIVQTDSTGKFASWSTAWMIEETGLVDPETDESYFVGSNSHTGWTKPPDADLWWPSLRALAALRKASGGLPPQAATEVLAYLNPPHDPTELLSYFNPPLDPSRQARFLDHVRLKKALGPR